TGNPIAAAVDRGDVALGDLVSEEGVGHGNGRAGRGEESSRDEEVEKKDEQEPSQRPAWWHRRLRRTSSRWSASGVVATRRVSGAARRVSQLSGRLRRGHGLARGSASLSMWAKVVRSGGPACMPVHAGGSLAGKLSSDDSST